MAEKRFEYRHATEEELEALKMREFAGWLHTYVSVLNKCLHYLPDFYTYVNVLNNFLYYLPLFYTYVSVLNKFLYYIFTICFINRCLKLWPEVKQLTIGYAR